MVRILPLVFALLLTAFMLYNPIGIAPNTLNQTVSTAQNSGLQGEEQKQISDYNIEDVMASNGDFDQDSTEAIFNNQPVEYPKKTLSDAFKMQQPQNSAVLGTTNASGEEKWIEVDLQKQQATAWEGSRIVYQHLISSGLWNSTHQGTFYIWLKTRNQKMSGGSKELGTYYYLPNVPNNMFFDGPIALHGAYWHNNFGHPMSHGCVNAPLVDAAWMFDWAGPVVPPGVNALRADASNPGTRVWVH